MWESFWFEFINFYFIPGLVLGCIYALGAIGITLTFGILRFANFAHGEIMMTSSYLTWEFVLVASSFGLILHPIIGAIPASICAIFLALIVDRFFYKPFRNSPTIMIVIASFGMMLIICLRNITNSFFNNITWLYTVDLGFFKENFPTVNVESSKYSFEYSRLPSPVGTNN